MNESLQYSVQYEQHDTITCWNIIYCSPEMSEENRRRDNRNQMHVTRRYAVDSPMRDISLDSSQLCLYNRLSGAQLCIV